MRVLTSLAGRFQFSIEKAYKVRTCEAQAGRGLDHVAHRGDARPMAFDPGLAARAWPSGRCRP